jgi:P27 family predicted phage terminase small subunit
MAIRYHPTTYNNFKIRVKEFYTLEYITGKQAQLILNITTRQGLHKIVKDKNISVKSQGAGKPNLYLESDIKTVAKKTNTQRLKTNPKLRKKIDKKKKTIETNITTIEESKKNAKEEMKKEHFSPLNEIGQDEFLRVEKLLTENGTYNELDRSLLLSYSIAYQKYINAVTMSAQQDDTTMDDFGNLKVHPYFTVADKSFTHMQKMAVMLGIGVRSRVGLDIAKGKKKSIFEFKEEKF